MSTTNSNLILSLYKIILKEILANSWVTLSADSNFLFDDQVSNKWSNAYRLLGVDPNKLSHHSGRA